MSIESLPSTNSHERNLVLDQSGIHGALEGVVTVATPEEALEQKREFERMALAFMDSPEARAMILDAYLDHPVEAFRGQFLALEQLYKGRMLGRGYYDGTQVSEFCTQDHERARADHLFRHTELPSGSEYYQVSKAFTSFGYPEVVTITLQNDQLSVQADTYSRGQRGRVELEGDRREQILAELFDGTLTASATHIMRDEAARFENDRQARDCLKKVRDSEYQGF